MRGRYVLIDRGYDGYCGFRIPKNLSLEVLEAWLSDDADLIAVADDPLCWPMPVVDRLVKGSRIQWEPVGQQDSEGYWTGSFGLPGAKGNIEIVKEDEAHCEKCVAMILAGIKKEDA